LNCRSQPGVGHGFRTSGFVDDFWKVHVIVSEENALMAVTRLVAVGIVGVRISAHRVPVHAGNIPHFIIIDQFVEALIRGAIGQAVQLIIKIGIIVESWISCRVPILV